MILYNITVSIEKAAEPEWLQWIKQVYVPSVMQSELFERHSVYRLLNETEGDDTSYALQFYAKDLSKLEEYLELHAPAILEAHNTRYKYRHVSFMTVLEEVS